MSWFNCKSKSAPEPQWEPDPHANEERYYSASGAGYASQSDEGSGLPAAPGEDPGEVQPDVSGHGDISGGLPSLGKRR